MSVPINVMEMQSLEPEREPDMTADEVLNAVDQEITWAEDWYQGELQGNRSLAWAYFKGSAPGQIDEDIDEYFENIVSHDVADAIESILAEILPAFATDRPAVFDPEGPGDEEAADIESDICNDILMESGSGYLELATAAKNALLLRIGVLEVRWDDQQDAVYHDSPAMSPEQLAILLQDPLMSARETEEGGIQIRELRKRQRCRVEAVPVDEFLVSSDCTSLDLDDARFVARQVLVSRSDLIAQGFDADTVAELPAYTHTSRRSRVERERNTWGREKLSGDKATDMIMIVRCYYRLDEDRDGIAERRRIVVGGLPGAWQLLDDEPASYQPFAAGVAYIWPHMPYGVSIFDKLKHIQDLRSKYWRIMLEAGQRAARDRVGIPPGVNLDDWETSTFGGGVRFSSSPPVAIPNSTFPAELGHLDAIALQARREGGGGALDKSNQESMPVEAGAHGVERFLSAIEEVNSMVARTLAETLVQQAYRKIHMTLRMYSPPIMRDIHGQPVQIDPGQWPERTKMSTSVGLTLSERGRLAQAYGYVAAKGSEANQAGSIIANETTIYKALTAQLRMMGVANPETYLVDPEGPEGQQAAQQRAQQAEQQQAEQQEQMARQAQMQMELVRLQTDAQQEINAAREQNRLMLEWVRLQQKTQSEAAKLTEDARQANQSDSLEAAKLEIEAGQNVPGSRV